MLHLAADSGNEKAGLFLVNNGANCSAVNDLVGSRQYFRFLQLTENLVACS